MADLLRTPNGPACSVLHGLPEIRLRIQASFFDLICIEYSLPFVQVAVNGRLVVVCISNIRNVWLSRFATFAKEVSNAPLDDIGVQEERVLSSVVGWV